VEHIALACRYIDLGAILGVSAMVIHTGYCSETKPATLNRKYAAQRDGLKKIADYAAPLGIMIYLENIFPFFESAHTALPERMAEEIAIIDHPQLAGCFDVSHAYIACNAYGAELTEQAKAISPLAPHWHVHDSFGRPLKKLSPYTQSEQLAYGIGDLHLAVGDGDLPWESVLTISKFSQELTFNIELHPELWSEMSNCVDATRRLIATVSDLKAA
jgi:sugar phosphate isomerase/epimerase